jgi:hypothetical protein
MAEAGRSGAAEAIEVAADQVAERMAAEGVSAQEADVDRENEAPHADAEISPAPVRLDRVEGEQGDEDEGEVERVTMQVLEQ